jgi:hypothetical protein
MKKFRLYRSSRSRRLPVVGWIFAWILLAAQGGAGAASPCSPEEAASRMEASMPEMTDHTAMSSRSMATAQTDGHHHSALCGHCRSRTNGHVCPGLQGCSAQIAALMDSSAMPRVGQLQLALLPTAVPRIAALAFDPPLRPPPA